jgi:predicted MPP superfamily phosphohydrolase
MVFFLMILVGIPLLSLAWWFWADRRLRLLGCRRVWRWVIFLSCLLLLGSYAWVLLDRRGLVEVPLAAPLYAAVLLWGLLFLPLMAVPTVVIWSLGQLLQRLLGRGDARIKKVEGGVRWTRREWLAAAVVGMPTFATLGTAGFSLPQTKRFRVRELSVTLANLPEALDGMRIAHLTDTHVGKFTQGQVLDEMVARTNALDADLVLFTGDLIDNSIRDLPAALRMLQQLRAKSGMFVIEGNHDLFDDPQGFVNGLREGGVNLLRNQVATVQMRGVAVQILGIVWNRHESEMEQDVEAVAGIADSRAFQILLAHHPHAFDRAAALGIPLTFAGHTHGGQLMVTQGVGAGPAMFRYWSGIYQKLGAALVVGNGTGNWFPLRVNAPAEIIHLTLRRG